LFIGGYHLWPPINIYSFVAPKAKADALMPTGISCNGFAAVKH